MFFLRTVFLIAQWMLVIHFCGVFSLFVSSANWLKMWSDYYLLTQDVVLSYEMMISPEVDCSLCELTTDQQQADADKELSKKEILDLPIAVAKKCEWNLFSWEISISVFPPQRGDAPIVPPPREMA